MSYPILIIKIYDNSCPDLFNKNTHLDHHDPILLHVHNWTGLRWILVMLTNVDLLFLIFLKEKKYKIQLAKNVDSHEIS